MEGRANLRFKASQPVIVRNPHRSDQNENLRQQDDEDRVWKHLLAAHSSIPIRRRGCGYVS